MEDEEEDPEERRQRLEAKEAAQNLGVAIGLAAGFAISAKQVHHREEEHELAQEELEGPTMGGLA